LKKDLAVDARPTIGFEKLGFGRRKMVEERRQYQRLVPNAPLFISLDDSKSGLLLDLCAGGLAVASLVPRNLDDLVSLAFDLPEGVGHIEAKATIAWTRDSGHLTGVRFVDLDDASQQQLSEWISTGTNLKLAPVTEEIEPVMVTRSTYAQVDPISDETRDQSAAHLRALFATSILNGETEPEVAESGPVAPEERERTGKSRHTIELFLAVVVLSWALVFLGYQMGSTGASRQTRDVVATPKVTEASSKPEIASVAAEPTPTPSPTRTTAPARTATPKAVSAPAAFSMDSGLVLQVGAMKLEDNASALAQDLRKKKFPAMVFRHGNDKLYRVAVGPYGDADSTAKAKEQLEKQGFKPLLQRWAGE
jgi:cell division septation protein DedD